MIPPMEMIPIDLPRLSLEWNFFPKEESPNLRISESGGTLIEKANRNPIEQAQGRGRRRKRGPSPTAPR